MASGFFLRSMSVVVSIGGMFITALLLGIVSGEHQLPQTMFEGLGSCTEAMEPAANLYPSRANLHNP